MAMFGLGANYDGEDVSERFLNSAIAGIGWSYDDAPSLHHIMRSFQVGDIVYIKAHPPNVGLIVKAIGLVRDSEVLASNVDRAYVLMRWVWHGNEIIGHIEDRYNVRNNTLYEEWNPNVRHRILDLLLSTTIPPAS